jgi:phage shock protein C
MTDDVKRLYRSRSQRMIAGVCGGLGEYLGTDATVIRLATVLLALVWPPLVVVYIIMILIVPEEPLSQVPGEAAAPAEEKQSSTE